MIQNGTVKKAFSLYKLSKNQLPIIYRIKLFMICILTGIQSYSALIPVAVSFLKQPEKYKEAKIQNPIIGAISILVNQKMKNM